MRDPFQNIPFGVNEVRLNARQWTWVAAIVALVATVTPWVWTQIERFDTGPDYRIPYALSRDYWLWQRRLRQTAPGQVLVLGDSVVWGEYVLPDGTLTHFLNTEARQPGRFVNAGVNGLFPLALEGLVEHFGGALRHRQVLLQCNLLWMSSPKADLQVRKEETFNHVELVPQFFPRIPCYRATVAERLDHLVSRQIGFLAWIGHLQSSYFAGKSILSWTLADDGGDPPHYPNSYKNPLAQITLRVPGPPARDLSRGPNSPRHRPWTATGQGPQSFDWVRLDTSLQWGAFQRLVKRLGGWGDRVFVLLGPFNEHMIAKENRAGYEDLCAGAMAWFEKERVPCLAPAVLPSDLYADASHPLTQGYKLLANRLYRNARFQQWIEVSPHY